MSGWSWLRVGAISGAIAVTAGAFGAHGLKERLDARSLEVFETAVRYHLVHSLAIVAVGLAAAIRPSKGAGASGWLFLVGVLLFSGALYVLAVSGQKWLGMVAAVGGLALIAGWLALAAAAGGRPEGTGA